MIFSNAVVAQSDIHGKGVFARRDFKKGEIVFMWDTSMKLVLEQVNRLSEEEKKYVTSVEKSVYLLLKSPEKYVNHSCSPNLEVKNYCDVALRDIHVGEEFTADYAKEDIPNLVLKCNCQSRNCRRIIHGGKNV